MLPRSRADSEDLTAGLRVRGADSLRVDGGEPAVSAEDEDVGGQLRYRCRDVARFPRDRRLDVAPSVILQRSGPALDVAPARHEAWELRERYRGAEDAVSVDRADRGVALALHHDAVVAH